MIKMITSNQITWKNKWEMDVVRTVWKHSTSQMGKEDEVVYVKYLLR